MIELIILKLLCYRSRMRMAIVRPNLAFLVTRSEYFLTIIFVMINVGHYGVFPRGERPIAVHMVSFDEGIPARIQYIWTWYTFIHFLSYYLGFSREFLHSFCYLLTQSHKLRSPWRKQLLNVWTRPREGTFDWLILICTRDGTLLRISQPIWSLKCWNLWVSLWGTEDRL